MRRLQYAQTFFSQYAQTFFNLPINQTVYYRNIYILEHNLLEQTFIHMSIQLDDPLILYLYILSLSNTCILYVVYDPYPAWGGASKFGGFYCRVAYLFSICVMAYPLANEVVAGFNKDREEDYASF